MSTITIQGKKTLSGSIPAYGSKNAALPLLAASILTQEEVVMANIPPITDCMRMEEIISSMGGTIIREKDTVIVHAKTINPERINTKTVGALRGSILLLGALLGRLRQVNLQKPGGDIIGSRPIEAHLDAFRQLGARIHEHKDSIIIDGSAMRPAHIILSEFSVTATENMLLVCSTLPGTSVIHIAAAEPHIEMLATMLECMGAHIEGAGTHTITVQGKKELSGASVANIPDMIEAGTFLLLGAISGSEITVRDVPVLNLHLFLHTLETIGINVDLIGKPAGPSGRVDARIAGGTPSPFHIKALPYPGLPTDLQAPFAVLATQAHGTSLIHDPMYEGRLKHIYELQKMGADAIICDPHRVIINGPTPLHGSTIPSLDIRSGVTLMIAGLIAEGTTVIENAEQIDRGYANIVERLSALGADITRT